MYARTWGETTCGINGEMIVVEVDVANGKFNFEIVGLADTAVKESRERVRSAIKNSSCKFPDQHITVNLAPADLKEDGSGLISSNRAFTISLSTSLKSFFFTNPVS